VTRLVLHIDRLVLRGIERADAAVVSAGVRTELQRLLAAPDTARALAAGGSKYRVEAGEVRVARGGGALGRAIAGGIARGIEPREGKPGGNKP